MQARGAALVVGGLGLFTLVMAATPDAVLWVLAAWILVIVALSAVGVGLVLVVRSHAATTGALTNDNVRPPPWSAPDPVYLWPGPRLLGGDIFELGEDRQQPAPTPVPAPAPLPQPVAAPVMRPTPGVPWWRRSGRTAVAAGLAGALLARIGEGLSDGKVSSGPAGR